MNEVTKALLRAVSDIDGEPAGAYNIRENSGCAGRHSTEAVEIAGKTDKPGIDIRVKEGVRGETIYIPAVITESDVDDLVYNDFYIGAGAEVTIVAGCGVHTDGDKPSRHNGIHRFFLRPNARVRYVEKHVGTGEGSGARLINPETYAELEAGSYMEMDTVQIKGVDSTKRVTKAKLAQAAKLIVKEKIMTHGAQYAETNFEVELNGAQSGADLVSHSVARDTSRQVFRSRMYGNAACNGHSECDAIIMDSAAVSAIPELTANHVDAALIHEAASLRLLFNPKSKLR